MHSKSRSLRSVALGRIYLRCLEKKNFMNEFPTQKQEKVSINIKCPQTIFEARSPTFARPQSFRCLPMGTLKTPCVFSSHTKRRETTPTHFCCVSTHSHLKGRDKPRSNVSMRVLIHVENILSIFCKS
jgi:hypothetical protein